jgi:hypothetical protein
MQSSFSPQEARAYHRLRLKIFTAFDIVVGIGILVEMARRLGMSFIRVRQQDKEAKAAKKAAAAAE